MIYKAVKISSVVALAGYAAMGSLATANAAPLPLKAVMFADARPVNAPTVVQTNGNTAPQAVASVDAGPSKAAAEDAGSAGGLLKRAFEFFKNDQNRAASDTFKAAIGTGNLNDAGRALAYWHIFVAEEAMGNRNASSDALSSFVVVAQDVMDIREHLRYAEDTSGDFVDRFDLKRRLARARAMLSVAWAYHTNWFGRSTTAPVPVHSTAEMNYFLKLAPPCARSHDRKVQASIARAVTGDAANVSEVDLSCDGSHEKTSYYFQVVAEDGQ